MAGGKEKSRYELLEISDPSTLLVRGSWRGERGCVKMILPGCFEKVNHCSFLHVLKC